MVAARKINSTTCKNIYDAASNERDRAGPATRSKLRFDRIDKYKYFIFFRDDEEKQIFNNGDNL